MPSGTHARVNVVPLTGLLIAGEGAPLCRWVQHEMTLDLMPLDETILGFSNRWYRSRDVEDLISVVEGRAELLGEVQPEALDVREYSSAETRRLLQTPRFLDALPGYRIATRRRSCYATRGYGARETPGGFFPLTI